MCLPVHYVHYINVRFSEYYARSLFLWPRRTISFSSGRRFPRSEYVVVCVLHYVPATAVGIAYLLYVYSCVCVYMLSALRVYYMCAVHRTVEYNYWEYGQFKLGDIHPLKHKRYVDGSCCASQLSPSLSLCLSRSLTLRRGCKWMLRNWLLCMRMCKQCSAFLFYFYFVSTFL